jgi:peptide/nickel transport system permease protein
MKVMGDSFHWLRRFLWHHKPALVGTVLIAFILGVAVLGPWVAPYGPTDVYEGSQPPTFAHWFGTDSQGYDLLARMVYGARTTLRIALLATVLSMALGTAVGAVAGFAGGRLDLLLMRVVDFAMSFPGFLLAMVTVAVLGKELTNVIYAVGLVGAPLFARQVRAEVIRVSAQPFIEAARAVGAPPGRVLLRHVMPNSVSPIIVLATLGMGSAILDVAGLNFLGLGGDPYQVPEWGLILKQGWQEIGRGTLQVTLAGLAIFITVLGFNLLGDGLRDELDPKARRAR